MVKRYTIVLHAVEEQVPLKLTVRQQVLVDVVVNRVFSAEHATVLPVVEPRPTTGDGRKPRRIR